MLSSATAVHPFTPVKGPGANPHTAVKHLFLLTAIFPTRLYWYMSPLPSPFVTSARDEDVMPDSWSEDAPPAQPADFTLYYDVDETASELVRTRTAILVLD